MSHDPKKASSWKQPGNAGPTPSQKRTWHPTNAAVPTTPRRRSWLLPALAGALLLGLIVVVILMLRGYRPARLIAIGPAGEDALAIAHNVGGSQSARAIAAWAKAGKSRPGLAGEPNDALKIEEWDQGLDGREDQVVVWLSAHGGADASGPYVWVMASDAPFAQPKHRLPLGKILDRLAELPEKKRKLLVLDVVHDSHHLATGQLHNDFARALRGLDGRIAQVPNLLVLCSADVDQRSWHSEEWQKSIFTHFFVEGATGAAGSDRVTIDRLFEYLKDQVTAWVRENRGEEQTPFLLPSVTGPDLARKMELASTQTSKYQAPASDKAPGAGFQPSDSLVKAWEQRERLEKLAPSPAAVAPHHWRRYQDVLLRVESMLRAGMPEGEASARLDRLAREEIVLTRAPWPELSSQGNALPMAAAVGAATPPMLDARRFQALWADPTNVWNELRSGVEGQGDAAIARLRLDVCRHVHDFLLAEAKFENLAKAAALLRTVFGPSATPVETHIVLLLDRDLDAATPPDWAVIAQALRLHRLAEDTALAGGAAPAEHPASELVYPWIRSVIGAADVERLRGHDLLLSTQRDDWTKGAARLAEAERQYQAIRKQAEQVRSALAARNQALAELPYLARWVAGLTDEFEREPEKPKKLLELVERTAEAMHRLGAMLEEADIRRISELPGLTAALAGGLQGLRKEFFDLLPALNAEVLVAKWRHIDNALQVPLVTAKKRIELLTNLRTISDSLNRGFTTKGKSATSARVVLSAQERAQRQGRISLALLGTGWINDPTVRDEAKGAIRFSFDDLKQRVVSPRPEWWESLNEAGEQLSRHWQALAIRANDLGDQARRETPRNAERTLARSDALARLVDSATALAKDRDPVADHRRCRLHRFLLDQARRTMDSQWGSADLAATRSFAEVTAEKFINDAEKIILLGAGENPTPEDRSRLLSEVVPVRDALKPAVISIQPAEPSIDLTDRRQFRVGFTFQRESSVPSGYPVLRYRRGGPCQLPAPLTTHRRPITDFVDSTANPANVVQTLDAEADLSSTTAAGFISAEVWFRGHRLDRSTRVAINREPSSIWVYNPPRGDAAFAVRAGPDVRTGAVAILLDWTRSMINPGPDKYAPACEALKSILGSLPADTVVSIRQFGVPDPDEPDKQPIVLAPRSRDFETSRDELERLIAQLQANRPNGIRSPVAQAIAQAADTGLPRDFPGFKTIVVLTDGEDNVDKDEAGRTVLRAIGERDIAVKIVFFQAQGEEEKRARRQFESIAKLEPAGEFFSANDKESLIASLREAMLPRVRAFTPGGELVRGLEFNGRSGVPVSLARSHLDRWKEGRISPGSYYLRTAGSQKGDILLTAGDRLLLELYRRDRSMAFRPAPYVQSAVPDDNRRLHGASMDAQQIRGALADARLVENQGGQQTYDLEMLLLMERGRLPDEIQVTRPQFTWVEVRTQIEGQGPEALMARIENQNYLPCPAWKVRVWKWPAAPGKANPLLGAARPAITMWWRDSFPRNPYLLSRDSRQSLDDRFAGKTFSLDQKQIKIDSVRFENKFLVVEVSYPAGPAAVFARPEGLIDAPRLNMEEEHRFYEKVGKYTARFGPVDEPRQAQAFTLAFYSMSELKSDASKVEVRPDLTPDKDHPLGQRTPGPIELK